MGKAYTSSLLTMATSGFSSCSDSEPLEFSTFYLDCSLSLFLLTYQKVARQSDVKERSPSQPLWAAC